MGWKFGRQGCRRLQLLQKNTSVSFNKEWSHQGYVKTTFASQDDDTWVEIDKEVDWNVSNVFADEPIYKSDKLKRPSKLAIFIHPLHKNKLLATPRAWTCSATLLTLLAKLVSIAVMMRNIQFAKDVANRRVKGAFRVVDFTAYNKKKDDT